MFSLHLKLLRLGQPQKIVSGPRAAKIFHKRAAVKFFSAKFWHFLKLALIVNVYLTLYWFFTKALYTVSKEATIKGYPKNKCDQTPC